MRYSFTLILSVIVTGVFGQSAITITSSDMPVAGEIIPTATSSPTGSKINVALTDSNYLWDFSNLAISAGAWDTVYDTKYVSKYPTIPASYLFTGFSGSTYAQRLSNGIKISTYSINNVYDMHCTSSKANTDWGFAGTVSGILPIPFKNHPLDTVYRFPLNYLNTDSSYSVYADSLSSLIAYYHRQMRYNLADGWGKVITPYGDTFTCLRVKSTIVGFDSLTVHYGGFTIPIGIPRTTVQYKWLAHGVHIPVMEIDATLAGSASTISSITFKRHVWSTGVGEIAPSGIAIKLYPIPANDILCVITDKATHLNIVDVSGKLIWQGDIETAKTIIHTQSWPAGEYLAQFYTHGVSNSRSFIITH